MKAVIFDMDGVLIDSFEAHLQAWDEAMHENYGFNVSREEFRETFGGDPHWIIKKWMKEHDVTDYSQMLRVHDEKQKNFKKISLEKSTIFPGVKESLDELKKDGVKLALASSNMRENIQALMEKTNLIQYFDAIVGNQDVEKAKPEPEIFLKAAEKLGVEPSECWVVEDSTLGVEAGKKAGMKVLGVMTGYRSEKELTDAGADKVVKDLIVLDIQDLKI